MCVFCDQRTITGTRTELESVRETVDRCVGTSSGREAEIAFFGGSFTGIGEELMISLLDLAKEYADRGLVSGIRMSTRPDYIDPHIVSVLKRYPVSQVELGIQSMDEDVLRACRRGHSPRDTERAVKLLREGGLSVGGQMMIGLPGSCPESEKECARFIADNCDSARIYPTVVFRDTELARMTERGEYDPLSVDDAVIRSADVLEILTGSGTECLRIGLCDSENLHSSAYLAGPNHPALGELVYGEIYYRIISAQLREKGISGCGAEISVPDRHMSKAVGLNGSNRKRIAGEFGLKSIRFRVDPGAPPYRVSVKKIDIGGN